MLGLVLAMAGMAHAQKPVKVEGVIEGAPAEMKVNVDFQKVGQYGEFVEKITLDVKKGKFSFTKDLEGIVKAWVEPVNETCAMPCNILLVPGENLKLTMKGEEFFCNGSKIYKEFNAADQALTPLSKAYSAYYEHALKQLENTPKEEQQAVVTKLNDTLTQKRLAYVEGMQKYASAHKNEEGAVLFLADFFSNADSLATLSAPIKDGRVGKHLQDRIDYTARVLAQRQKEAEEAQAKLDAMTGSPAKDFTLKNLDGNDLSLSSLRGKYVVLDFWGSWCGWCIKGIPDMKKYYEKYAGKFEILGIDCNDTDEAWRKAVKQYELPWLHVYNPRTSTVLTDYAIQGFPTKIVIDPQGNVAKIIVGEDPEFYTYLDSLFQDK